MKQKSQTAIVSIYRLLLNWGWQTHSLWTAEGSPAICRTVRTV